MISARFRLPCCYRSGLVMLIGLGLATAEAVGQDEPPTKTAGKVVEPSLQLITESNISQLTIEIEPLVAWVKPIIQGVEKQFSAEKARRDVAIQILLRKQGDPEVVVAGRPALSEAETKALLGLLDLSKAPHPKVVDFSFRINAKVNGGDPDPKRAFEPNLVDPFETFRDRFARASTAEQVSLLRSWAREQALPVIAAAAVRADPKFEGVVNFGKTLGKLPLDKDLDVEALTDRNHDYWRAMLEMVPGDLTVPIARVILHASKGEFDKARRFSEIAGVFDANQTASSRLLGEFRALYAIFAKGIDTRVNQGIMLHDQGQFAQAIATYDAILHDYPDSAWTTYERFHSQRSLLLEQKKSIDEAHAGWPEARAAIIAHDPLYPTLALASGREEAFQLLRRAGINNLFQDRTKRSADMLSYADIARDLGQYGYSSPIYWYILTRFKPETYAGREPIEDFLYGLELLGMKDLKENFKGDHAAAFRPNHRRSREAQRSRPRLELHQRIQPRSMIRRRQTRPRIDRP